MENYNEKIKKYGCVMKKSVISDYWRLLDMDDNVIFDDPACEEVYNEETAYYLFLEFLETLCQK